MPLSGRGLFKYFAHGYFRKRIYRCILLVEHSPEDLQLLMVVLDKNIFFEFKLQPLDMVGCYVGQINQLVNGKLNY